MSEPSSSDRYQDTVRSDHNRRNWPTVIKDARPDTDHRVWVYHSFWRSPFGFSIFPRLGLGHICCKLPFIEKQQEQQDKMSAVIRNVETVLAFCFLLSSFFSSFLTVTYSEGWRGSPSWYLKVQIWLLHKVKGPEQLAVSKSLLLSLLTTCLWTSAAPVQCNVRCLGLSEILTVT